MAILKHGILNGTAQHSTGAKLASAFPKLFAQKWKLVSEKFHSGGHLQKFAF